MDKNMNEVYLSIILYYLFVIKGMVLNNVSLDLDHYFKCRDNITIIIYYYNYLVAYYFPP